MKKLLLGLLCLSVSFQVLAEFTARDKVVMDLSFTKAMECSLEQHIYSSVADSKEKGKTINEIINGASKPALINTIKNAYNNYEEFKKDFEKEYGYPPTPAATFYGIDRYRKCIDLAKEKVKTKIENM